MKKDTRSTIIVAVIAFVIIVITTVYLVVVSRTFINDIVNDDISSGIKWSGNSITVNRDKPEKYIAIPCFTDMNFIANQTSQKVNIYNPEDNECIMNFSIVLSDGTAIWESDNTHPGYGFHDIELTQTLSNVIGD